MRYLIPLIAAAALAACAPPEVESQSGVGFQDYTLYQQQQAYLARSRAAPAPLTPVAASSPPPAAPASEPQAVAAAALAALGRAPAGAGSPEPIGAPLSATAPLLEAAPAMPAALAPVTVAATTAPAPGPAGRANIAAFALATSHPIGQQMYRRANPFRNSGSHERACARYPADSLAQEAFLEAGGPERDRLNLDPDGDGYACEWNPAPFRLARGG